MGNLEDCRLQSVTGSDHALLRFLFNVSSEEESDPSILEFQNEGLVIDEGRRWGLVSGRSEVRRVEEREANPVDFNRSLVFVDKRGRNSSSLEGSLELGICLGGGRKSIGPEFADREMGSDERKAFQMVGIRMGENEVVDPTNLFPPKKRCDHLPSDVETLIMKPSSVDQHFTASREFDQDGVSLSHIKKGDPEFLLKEVLPVAVGHEKGEEQAETHKEIPGDANFSKVHRKE